MEEQCFYLGRWVTGDAAPASAVRYDPADLTTHAVLVGMTGSGKTGLLITMLEEAARQGLPAIIIDPKGDLTNLLLHFPALRPADFEPWLDAEAARRQNLSLPALAEKTAARWKAGLAEWDLGPDELTRLGDAVDYRIFTPGSTAATPVNLLSSFAAPPLPWEEHREMLRERIASTVTALLGLIGLTEIDPLRSREHILLSNLLEHAWSRGQSLDLSELILQVQEPPIERLGAFPLERFFPEKERFELALLLNNFLAAPSFQTWLEGQPLDAAELLAAPNGKPRFSIFYLAHLSETERMFFVTLLLASVETWMRAQRGSSGLRALLAFDEIVGYLPPVANPPSRPVLLRLLKQGRAFGLGLALATQNPVDLNYKALSNAGTWFIGRLQTEQDKQRLLDGLQSLEGGIDRAAFDALMANIKPRVFLLHNIHQGSPRLFTTRWALNYLAGPLTRAQLPAFRSLAPAAPQAPASKSVVYDNGTPLSIFPSLSPVGAHRDAPSLNAPPPVPIQSAPRPPAQPASRPPHERTSTRPPVPNGINEYTLPAVLSLQKALAAIGGTYIGPLEPLGLLYRPALIAQAEVRYLARKYNLQYARRSACLVPPTGRAAWDTCQRSPFDADQLNALPLPAARYAPLPGEWSSPRALAALEKDFIDFVYRTGSITLRANEALKIFAAPDLPASEFQRQLQEAARAGMQLEINKLTAAIDTKLEALKRRIERQEDRIDRREDDVGHRKNEQTGADFELITSLFTRRKRSLSSSLSKRRLTKEAETSLREAQKELDELEAEWNQLLEERKTAVQRAAAEWEARADQVSEILLPPYRKDIFIELFGIAWLPFYQIQARDQMVEAPAYT